MQIKSNMEQAEIFVFIASFFLIALGFTESNKPQQEAKPHDKPPIIELYETSEYKFDSGRAELKPDFKKYIRGELRPEILRITKEYPIDVIEVIGHTDGQPITGVNSPTENNYSNLDYSLEKVNLGKLPVAQLRPGSNTDLGIMRALAVVQELKKSGGEIAKLKFRTYSAGQLLLENGLPADIDKRGNSKRRRIEIRFTKLGKTEKVQ
ncbi:hypothetical protein CEP10_02000 [Cylindrospermopsis raciborskii S07]|uniref:OmpA/MotB family protein n=1 Tax=Cylindrospermopsis raciborskii TaxID=77022 RepID=UPI000C9E4C36|nr:hypothetical protein [Cylindrospermopsis raciborskii]PNK08176.1 hypothetical protein CEP11_02215 [Cylindrospermopsis raciborskii S10]PNK10426.1 hypothetical protein CEP10_02000 [Cylindrospermopsis raciborskii S07]PNK10570.1 hypothetical protein CEP09_17710 [Cylindrospermopsis raciborskii S06]PNK10713.1 hypothetical protein CEP12_04190 [Cylindrospermopsis raciborskii S14]PNK12293.1 hypothetical protein CEP08_17510 [Cylindrospermopsis raciborskii S05]